MGAASKSATDSLLPVHFEMSIIHLCACGEMADTIDLGSIASRHAGSSPVTRTKCIFGTFFSAFFIFQKIRTPILRYNKAMNILGHFQTITHHRHMVCHYCFKLHLYWQGLCHDLSKYSFAEFYYGAKFYQGYRSPTEQERELYGYSIAWMHHKGRNRHHFEYWTDIGKNGVYAPVEMPIRYVKEMFCDRVAACRIYLKDKYTDASAYDYYVSHNARSKMNPKTADLLESWLLMLKEKGERETFTYILRNYPN